VARVGVERGRLYVQRYHIGPRLHGLPSFKPTDKQITLNGTGPAAEWSCPAGETRKETEPQAIR
jgi:hypothetical protein